MKFIDLDNLKKFWNQVNLCKQNKLPDGNPGQVLTKTEDGITWTDMESVMLQDVYDKIEALENLIKELHPAPPEIDPEATDAVIEIYEIESAENINRTLLGRCNVSINKVEGTDTVCNTPNGQNMGIGNTLLNYTALYGEEYIVMQRDNNNSARFFNDKIDFGDDYTKAPTINYLNKNCFYYNARYKDFVIYNTDSVQTVENGYRLTESIDDFFNIVGNRRMFAIKIIPKSE